MGYILDDSITHENDPRKIDNGKRKLRNFVKSLPKDKVRKLGRNFVSLSLHIE